MVQNTNAALTFFGDRASFDAANPGLPVEDFENTLLPAGSFGVISGSLNSSTDDGTTYAAGSILDGISLSVIMTPPATNDHLALLTTGFISLPSTAVGANSIFNKIDIDFSSSPGGGVLAVGLDMIGVFDSTTVNFEIFGPSGLLGNGSVTAGPTGGFFGVSSDSDLITNIIGSDGFADVYDNIAFGGGVTHMPEPSTYALLALGTGIMMFIQRRRKGR